MNELTSLGDASHMDDQQKVQINSVSGLVERTVALLQKRGGRRILLGIVGPPGAGKSHMASELQASLRRAGIEEVAIIPMDGFHLSNEELDAKCLRHKKGSPETFDGLAFVNLVKQLRDDLESQIFAPGFSREHEKTVPEMHCVSARCRIVIIEGNYLLLDENPWSSLAAYLDETWFIHAPVSTLRKRLIDRQIAGGKSLSEAKGWVERSDLANAIIVRSCLPRADVIISLPEAEG